MKLLNFFKKTPELGTKLPFEDYRSVNLYRNFKLEFSKQLYTPLILHTRDYVFSDSFPEVYCSPQKVVTYLNIIYLQLSPLYWKLSRKNAKVFAQEMEFFNLHWAHFLFETEMNWKVFKELQRSWKEVRELTLDCLEGREDSQEFIEQVVYEAENNLGQEHTQLIWSHVEDINEKVQKVPDLSKWQWV